MRTVYTSFPITPNNFDTQSHRFFEAVRSGHPFQVPDKWLALLNLCFAIGSNYSNLAHNTSDNLQSLPNVPANPAFQPWPLGGDQTYLAAPVTPDLCGCGPSCACPGCAEHRGSTVDQSAACSNPTSCVACLDCNINSMTALATDTSSTIYDSAQLQSIDDWLRQVSSMPDLPSSTLPPPVFPSAGAQSQPNLRYDPAPMQSYGMWGDPQTASSFSSTIIEEAQDSGSERTLTFATSGERGSRSGGGGRSTDVMANAVPSRRMSSGAAGGPPMSPSGRWLAPPQLTVPQGSLSRASSSSSKSSGHPSTSSASPVPFGEALDTAQRSNAMDPAVASCCSSMGNLSTSPSNVLGSASGSHRRSADHNEYRTNSSNYSRPF